MGTITKSSPAAGPQPDAQAERPPARPPELVPPNLPEESPRPARRNRAPAAATPRHLFTVGFYTALVIAMLCLLMGALYLYRFMESANAGIERLLDNAAVQAQSRRPQAEGGAARAQDGAESGRGPAAAKTTSPAEGRAGAPTQGAEPAGPAEAPEAPTLRPGHLEALINGRLVMARLALLSCGVSVAFAFGFLGFALFLLGIKGSIDAEVHADSYKATFARLSPGLLLLLASMVLIGICVTHPTPFEYSTTETVEGGGASSPAPRRQPPQGDRDGEAAGEQLPPRVE